LSFTNEQIHAEVLEDERVTSGAGFGMAIGSAINGIRFAPRAPKAPPKQPRNTAVPAPKQPEIQASPAPPKTPEMHGPPAPAKQPEMHGPPKPPYLDERPKARIKTIKQAWNKAKPGTKENSKACPDCNKDVFGNPNTGELRNTPDGWDLEHVNKWEKIRRGLQARGAKPKEYRDAYNDFDNTILRCRTCNRADNKVDDE
jgi:hypothetical protein